MTTNLTHLEVSFEEVENHLLNLRDSCERCEWECRKLMVVLSVLNILRNLQSAFIPIKSE